MKFGALAGSQATRIGQIVTRLWRFPEMRFATCPITVRRLDFLWSDSVGLESDKWVTRELPQIDMTLSISKEGRHHKKETPRDRPPDERKLWYVDEWSGCTPISTQGYDNRTVFIHPRLVDFGDYGRRRWKSLSNLSVQLTAATASKKEKETVFEALLCDEDHDAFGSV